MAEDPITEEDQYPITEEDQYYLIVRSDGFAAAEAWWLKHSTCPCCATSRRNGVRD